MEYECNYRRFQDRATHKGQNCEAGLIELLLYNMLKFQVCLHILILFIHVFDKKDQVDPTFTHA